MQRHGIVIDTCVVGRQDSAFLQQAAHISEGVYLRPKHTGALLQYLLVGKSAVVVPELDSNVSWVICASPHAACNTDHSACVGVLQTVYAADTYTRSFMQMPKLTGLPN